MEMARPGLPFANGFPTPNGKARIYDGELIALGMDPVASFVPPEESRHQAAAAAQYPLELLARKADNFLNSTFVNHPEPSEDGTAAARSGNISQTMPSVAASPMAIGSGSSIDRGEIFLRARVDGSVQTGVVGAKLGWAKLSEGGFNINLLTSDRLTDLGGGATFYSTLVEVERADATSTVTEG